MASLAEQRAILQELHTLGIADLSELMRRAAEFPDFFAFIVDAFPELVAQYASTSAELAAMWYEDEAPNLPYSAVPATVPTLEQFAESAKWALGSGGGNLAFAKLSGVLQRGVWGTARDTTVLNAESERGARYARHASANACEFCRMVATRGAVYTSAATASGVVGRGKDVSTNYDPVTGKRKRGGQAKGVRVRGSQKVGSKYHDNCRCMAVAVRPGKSYEPPPYVEKWEQEYVEAVRAASAAGRTKGEYGAIDVKAVMAAMRQNAKN